MSHLQGSSNVWVCNANARCSPMATSYGGWTPKPKWKWHIDVSWPSTQSHYHQEQTGILNKMRHRGHFHLPQSPHVTKGFTKTAGLNYEETFTPVAHLDSLWLLLAAGGTFDWEVYHINIKSAFLNSYLDEELCIAQPQGIELQGHEMKVY